MAEQVHQARPRAGPVTAKNFTKTPKVVSKLVKPLKLFMRLMSELTSFLHAEMRARMTNPTNGHSAAATTEKSRRPIG
ncbi:hypothetical protein ACLQ3B_27495 [Micromonospora sp. DT53]|uniref:hypothetical protein n=1 Tax=Micromonospora sp. DT53 TaxID=3393444 RepID=UPI003CF1D69F